jgi:hypothetical protein
MNDKQYEALVQKIYDSLISNPEFGLGEMGECRGEARRIVSEWMDENGIKIIEESKDKDPVKQILNWKPDTFVKGAKYGDTEYDSESAVYGYNQCLENVQLMLKHFSTAEEQEAASNN